MSLHALARLYPAKPRAAASSDFEAAPGESLADTIARFRALAQLA